METHAEEATKAVTSAERKLQNALEQKESDYATFEPLLEKLRIRSGNLALLTLTTDQSAEKIESRLWDFHVRVNGKFKPHLRSFREGAGKKKHVERRKAHKLYTDFIKASQRFYRAYVERLTANFTNIPRVEAIARTLAKEGLTAQAQKVASDEQRDVLEKSCKQCIIRLGDLSRWRETELRPNEWNWGPAKGYYNLALTLDPAEGTCFNQLAVISLNGDDHLGAVYYLYRATAAAKPFPTAPDNLKVEFEKVLKIRVEESYGMVDKSDDTIVSTLEKRFLAFHAHCFARPYDFVAFHQRATDILGMVTLCFQVEAKTGGFGRFMYRATLINMAAESLAKSGMEEPATLKKLTADKLAREIERNCQSYFLFQRFNLMFFQALLKILARELGEPALDDQDLSDLSRLSPVVGKVLPHLRQYSSWFLSHMRELVETKYKSSRKLLEQVSKTYVQALNLLRSNVDVFASSPISYLLAEDEQTLSFSPYSPTVFKWRYQNPDGAVKPVRPVAAETKDLDEQVQLAETHLRATDLVVDALRLLKHQEDLNLTIVPIALENAQFVDRELPEAELPRPPPSPPKKLWRSSKAHIRGPSINGNTDSPDKAAPESAAPVQAQLGVTPEVEMTDATDVPREKSVNGSIHPRAVEPTGFTHSAVEEMPATLNSSSIVVGTPAQPATGMTAMDLVRQMQRSSVGSSVSQRSPDSGKKFSQPAPLPSVYKTPFAPTAGEQAQLSPRVDISQTRSPTFHTPSISSSAIFQEQLARQQQEVQQRTSPQMPFQPTPSWDTFGQTPTGMDSMLRVFEHNKTRTPSPYASNHSQINGRSPQPKYTSNPAPFGVIGQARPMSRGTPTSGQS